MKTNFKIFEDKNLYTCKQIAYKIGSHKLTVYNLLKKMKIHHTKLNPDGRTQFYLGSDINQILFKNSSIGKSNGN